MTSANGDAERGGPRAMLFLMLVVFINIAGFGIVIPLLPFFATSLGLDAWEVTLLFSAYSLGQFAGEPLWGRVSDRFGRRPVLVVTMAATAASYVALAFAGSFWTALLLRLGGGLAAANISTIQAYVADITPPERRVGRMGLIGSVFGLGFVVGPALGGLLTRPELGSAGYRLPLLMAALLAAIAMLGILLFVGESRSKGHHEVVSGFHSLGEAWHNPVVRRVLFAATVATGAFSAMEAVFALWGQARFGWGPHEVGLIFAFIGTLSAITQGLLTGRIVARIGEVATLTVGLAITSLSLLLQALSPYGWLVVVVTTFTVLGVSMTQPSISGLISRATPPQHQGAMLGVNGAMSAMARIVGPIIAGFLLSGVGINAPYYFAAAMLLPAVLLAWRTGPSVRALHASPVS